MVESAEQAQTVWEPTAEWIASSHVRRFMRAHGIADAATLRRRSVEDIRWFWDAALQDLGVEWFTPYTQVLDDSAGFAWARWFVGGELNLVHNCVTRHAVGARAQQAAVVWEGDGGEQRTLTFAELAADIARLAHALTTLGVRRGDAVGLYLPMTPEVVIGMFACHQLGAVAVPIFSGYGPDAIATRLNDAQAVAVLTADIGMRRGRAVPLKQTLDTALATVPSVRHVIVARRGTETTSVPWHAGRDQWWTDAVRESAPTTEIARLPAEAPALILYTSGTTGRPKGCVHTHAGALAQIAKELGYHFDVRPGDIFFWMTDIGWMMGPWELVGALFHGATVVLYEGVPDFPAPDRLWRLVERYRVTHLGISPTAIRVLKRAGDDWVTRCDLASLRVLGSTGEPWDPEGYTWFFEQVGGKRCPIINISGGTEIIGCHLAPLPIAPLKTASLQGPGLGMDVDVFNEAGESVRGEIGYLVCKQPAPSMTKGFLNDSPRYLETYFSKWPQIWNHGDWAVVDRDGAWFLMGRADDTIKVAGKRVGPAEIEGVLMQHAAVAEAAVIGVPHAVKGEGIVCFVVLKDACAGDAVLATTLRQHVATALGKPMQPETVVFVPALPKTRSAKIVRGAIRRVWLGEAAGDLSSVENPGVLEDIATCKVQQPSTL
ncbi:MAG: AMP-binding protein [Deltaproteobacteria bacterium]|nr:AMP-binding protein [Deltaproteobacteria bacterium]